MIDRITSRALKLHSRIPLLICKRTVIEPKRGGYPLVYDRPPEELTLPQRIQRACREFGGQWKLYMKELRNNYKLLSLPQPYSEIDVVWKFDGTQNSLDQWIVNSDRDYHHGFSIAKLELSSSGTGIFHGTLDTRLPKDGKTVNTGYCNITTVEKLISFKRKVRIDWNMYNTLILRIRGDGRQYILNITYDEEIDILKYYSSYYLMYTRGGPYWQTVQIPFSKFVTGRKGSIELTQSGMATNRIKTFGITLADKIPGHFKLEIDYIGVSDEPANFEECAYEMYDVIRD